MTEQDTSQLQTRLELEASRRRVALLEALEAEHAQTARMLRKERDLIAAVLSTTGALVVVLNPQGRVVRFNRACEQATGYSFYQVREQSLADLLLPPADVASFQTLCRQLRAGQTLEGYENVWITRDGRRRLIAWSHTALWDDAGAVEYIIGTGVDITARRQAEEAVHQEELRLNSLLELSQMASELSEQEIIQRTLEEAVKLTQSQIGYLHFVNPDQETLQLHTWSQQALTACTATHDAHYPLSRAGVWADCARHKQPVIHNDYQQLPDRRGYPDGHSHLVRHVSVPVLDGDLVSLILGVGNKSSDYHDADVRQMLLVAENLWRIIRRKRLEVQLHQHVRALEEEDRHKNEFLAMLAHELRNPLAPICNAVQLLGTSAASDAPTAKVREVLRRQLDHLVRLVDDLLDVSRINQGKIELQCQSLDLADVLEHAVEISRALIEASGHTLSVTSPTEPVCVYGDAVRLTQVVANLLNNAAKYTLAGGQIRLSVEREAGEAVLRVQDNGIGIPAEVLPRIFDLFVQADHPLARAQGGLGLGLSLVRTLVELHGGTVRACSAGAGQGSELTVRMPLLDAGAERGAPLHLLSSSRLPMEWEGEAPAEPVPAHGSAGASPSRLDVPSTAQDSIGDGTGTASRDVGIDAKVHDLAEPVPVSSRFPVPPGDAAKVLPRLRTRVLIVDDNQDAATMLAELLGGFDLEVLVAYDGPSALQTVQTARPQAVLLDIGLPDMDGYEVARRLRSQSSGRELRLIALTGYGDAAARQRSQAAGFDHHLVKPVNLDVLLSLLTPSA